MPCLHNVGRHLCNPGPTSIKVRPNLLEVQFNFTQILSLQQNGTAFADTLSLFHRSLSTNLQTIKLLRMQQPNAGSTRARSGLKAVPLCKLNLVAASRSYLSPSATCAGGVFLSPTSTNTPLGHQLQLAPVVFFM